MLIDAPNVDAPLDLRGRIMVELMHASGLCMPEIAALKTVEVGLNKGVVRVIDGKGGKDHLVSLDIEAGDWLWRYLRDSRTALLGERIADALFVAAYGEGMTCQVLWYFIRRYALLADIRVSSSPHTLRHASAIHSLNHGTDLCIVQMLLGHVDISTA